MISQCLTEMVKMILHLNLEWKLGTEGNFVQILYNAMEEFICVLILHGVC